MYGNRVGRAPSNASQRWNSLHEEGGWDGTGVNLVEQIDAIGGTYNNLRAFASVAPGASKSWALTIQKNGTSQSITCTISGASSTSCSDTTNSFSTVAGDQVNITVVPTGTPTAANVYYTILWNNSTDFLNAILGMMTNSTLSTTSTEYMGLQGANSNAQATETNSQQIASTAGVLQNLYVEVSVAPNNGAGTQSHIFTIMQNGSATAITCTISEAATTCNDTSNSINISAGDRLSMRHTIAGTPAASSRPHYGIQFTATNVNESMWMTGLELTPSTSATNYTAIVDKANWNATETNVQSIVQAGTFKNLYVNVTTAPDNGVGTQSYVYTVNKNAIPTSVTCTISEASTSCNDTTNSFTVADDDLITISAAPSGTPIASTTQLGLTHVIARRIFFN